MGNVLSILLIAAFIVGILFTACKKEYSCESCIANNKPPIAIAGPDQSITLPVDSVLLDGSLSTDQDGKITGWRWTKLQGPASSVIYAPQSTQTRIGGLVIGIYQFELQVTDDKGASARDTLQITVGANNLPPVACAGPDQTITLPLNSVQLNGSCSADPDNNITSYAWTKISGPSSFSLVNASGVQTQANNLVEGTYFFELKVTDAGGLFSMDTVQVIVGMAVDVYVAGGIETVATYWKNGFPISLSASPAGQASSIFVEGNDVYVAGMEGNDINAPFFHSSRVKYWKNGQEVLLTGSTALEGSSIYVAGPDVYVAGSDKDVAKYWKNGQEHILNDPAFFGRAQSIVVVGSDIYVAGSVEGVGAFYWKNGQAVQLPAGIYANSIAVVGNDVYVAGAGWPSQNPNYVAMYWKNGQAISLSNGFSNAFATSITVVNNDVYVCGYEENGTRSTAKYWKNGQEYLLTTGVNNGRTFATSIAVFGSDVYVAGFIEGGTTNSDALYWKNGDAVFLTNGSYFSQARSIKVVPR